MKQLFFSVLIIYTCLVFSFHFAACNKSLHFDADTTTTIVTPPSVIPFENTPTTLPMKTFIGEASGIADSKISPGYLWVEEDSGNPPQLYLLNHAATTVKKVYIKGATNRDWEDIALAAGPDPSKKYLYVAEIGDNDGNHPSSSFYRFEEPTASTDTVRVFDLINFTYADGPRDAEAFLIDDNTKDIYIISKRDTKSRLYKIAWPYSTSAVNTAVFVQELPYNGVVSAAISTDGKEIIVKTYVALYYYSKNTGESVAQTLQKTYTELGYVLEPQGEAVCFALDNSGFYTLSELGLGSTQSLYFYKRK